MKKKWIRIIVITLSSIILLLVLANFGLNYWLQNNLPNYIKKNTDYTIDFKNFEVDLGTGDIMITGISIKNKNAKNDAILGLNGTVDSLEISRFGIFDAIFNNNISASRLKLSNPNLNIALANSTKNQNSNKKNELPFRNLEIKNGNISIFKSNKSKYFAVKNLNVNIKNVELLDENSNQLLPIGFDEQEINGEDFYFRSSNIQIVKADKIHTENKVVSIDNFEIIPLLNAEQFTKNYPNKPNYFQGKIAKIGLKDFALKVDKISISTLEMVQPDIKMYIFEPLQKKKDKPFNNNIILENLKITNANFKVLKGQNKIFSSENMQVAVSELVMNKATSNKKIPFTYKDFTVSGRNVESFSDHQNFKINNAKITPTSVQLNNILVEKNGDFNTKTSMNGSIKNMDIKINEWNFDEEKLKLEVENVLINGLNGELTLAKNNENKRKSISGIEFPLLVKKISLKNSNLTLNTGKQPLDFKNLNAEILNIEMNEQTVKNKTPFKMGSYRISASNFNYRLSEFYNATVASIYITDKKIDLKNLVVKPLVSRAQFVRRIPKERDLYDLKISQLTANGKWDFFSNTIQVDANNVNINGMDANIFRSKIPKDDLTEKLLYSSMLKTIKFPLFVGDFNINNSKLVYEEDTPKSDGPGKLIFNNFNLNAKNINCGKSAGKPTKIPIVIKCSMMNTMPLTVNWTFDTAKNDDQFSISGYTGNMPAPQLNLFIEPYLKIRATGNISKLSFNFNGNRRTLNGSLKMAHQDLKVEVLKKDGEKDGIISAVANIFVKTDSGKYPESVSVENVKRDNTKSFFNFLWRGLEEGLKKTLIGDFASSTTAKPVGKMAPKPKEEPKKEEKKEEKKGFFQRIFK